jgi:uncharacterized Zn-finger protein
MADKNYVCPVPGCPKRFRSKFNLKRHIDVVHLGCNRCICPICGKTLTCKQNLQQHFPIHIGDKPFICPEPGCAQAFRQASLLSSHKKLHRAPPQPQADCHLNVSGRQLAKLVCFSRDRDVNPLLSYRNC